MHKIVLLITLFIATALTTYTQTPTKAANETNNIEQAILKLTQEWLDADEHQDRAALNRIIADDFLGTGPMGTIVSKTDVIPREGTGAEAHGLFISGQDMKARVFGDTAIVTGRGVPKAQRSNRPEVRFTLVFVKRGDRWQMVAGHLSGIPTE
jgi:ketosteroid isomerase-like protein